ncbi:MAG: porin [Burkholderia sp.]|nr:porin [Burkholderia sp.]
MNKTIIIAAAAAAFTTTAYAKDLQNAKSGLVLYGMLDTAVTYRSNIDNNENNEWLIRSGITKSNFGLRGLEDIGAGLKAIFKLESEINITNASIDDPNRSLFNREAYIGLLSNSGLISVGRQYDAVQDYLSPISAAGSWGGMYFSHVKNKDFLFKSSDLSLNSTVKFTSNEYNGLRFGGTYSIPSKKDIPTKTAYSAGVSYQCKDFHIAASYLKIDKKVDKNGHLTKNLAYGVGANYKIGPAKIGALWTRSFKDAFANKSGYRDLNTYEVNARYNLTPNLAISASYSYMDSRREKNEEFSVLSQVGVQTDYMLSKRTGLYAQVQYQYLINSTDDNSYIYDDFDPSSENRSIGKDQIVAQVGLRHSF